MKKTEKLILELCKSNGDSSIISSFINLPTLNWDFFLSLLAKHMIGAVVLDRLVKFPLPAEQSDRINRLSLDIAIKIKHNNRLFLNEIQRFSKLLNDNNIDIILMKGLSIDTGMMRMIGDIDILIREDKTLQSIELLKKLDYSYIGSKINHLVKKHEKDRIDLQLPWNNQFQLINNKTRVMLEIHTNLFERARVYDEDITSLLDNIDLFWEHKTFNEKLSSYTFSAEHSLILMCMHNAIKRSPASNLFILRTIMDIDSLVNQQINWEIIKETSIKLNIAHYIYFSLSLTHNLLGSIIPTDILSDLYENLTIQQRFMTNLHLKCIKSLRRSSIIYSNLYKILTPFFLNNRWINRIKWMFLIPVFFPSRWRMAKNFHLKTTSPLLPFTYILNPLRLLYILISKALSHIIDRHI